MKKEKGEISLYDMSINFCDIPQVKESIELQGKDEKMPLTLLKHHSENSNFGESTSIYANNKQETKNPDHLHQCFVSLLANNTNRNNKKLSLETATQSIVTAFFKKKKTSSTLLENELQTKNILSTNLENDENDIIFIPTNDDYSRSLLSSETALQKNTKTCSSKPSSRFFYALNFIIFLKYKNRFKFFELF